MENSMLKGKERNRYLKEEISISTDQLESIRSNPVFDRAIRTGDFRDLSNLFSYIIHSNSNIMQIRYLDGEGDERLRWDRMEEGEIPFRIRESELQNKGNRYYFSASVTRDEKVWYSDLDLNIEHGVVEVPFRPVYRAILPVHVNGHFHGILIINYFVEKILDELADTPLYDTSLVDGEGFILFHPDPSMRWSRYRKPQFKADNETLGAIQSGEILGTNLFVQELDLPLGNQLFLTLRLRGDYLENQMTEYHNRLFFVMGILFLYAILGSAILFILFSSLTQSIAEKDEDIKKSHAREKRSMDLLIQQSKMAALGEMIAAIAHQWRQPLNSLNATLTNIVDASLFGELNHEYLLKQIENGEKQIQFMSETVDGFRNFFHPARDKEVFSIGEAFLETVQLVKVSFQKHGVEIESEIFGDYYLNGYKNLLKQVFLIFLKNAKDAIVRNGIKDGMIQFRIESNQNEVLLYFQDNGGGISAENLPHLFEPYFTTNPASEGTGLGLYMSRLIVESFEGGQVTIANQGAGAEVKISLSISNLAIYHGESEGSM